MTRSTGAQHERRRPRRDPSNQQDLVEKVQADREDPRPGDEKEALLATGNPGESVDRRSWQGGGKAGNREAGSRLLLRANDKAALHPAAVVAPVPVMGAIGAASRRMIVLGRVVLPPGQREMIMRLSTGMRVVPAAPQQCVGEQHYHSQVGCKFAQSSPSILHNRHNRSYDVGQTSSTPRKAQPSRLAPSGWPSRTDPADGGVAQSREHESSRLS